MKSKNLDLKYRPSKFSEVLGNHGILKLLKTRSTQKTIGGRSMMFGGPKGCGKTSLARIVARSIVCDDLKAGEPCGSCASCSSIKEETMSNFEEFDAATQGTVDHIRSILEDLDFGSFGNKPSVIVLDEAHRLSLASQDALLKSVEDRRLVVILCTTEPHKIKPTIRSRVEEYSVSPPTFDEMKSRMLDICTKESISCDAEAIDVIIRTLSCCPRECLSTLETLSCFDKIELNDVKSYLRFDHMEKIAEILSKIDSDPGVALSSLDDLASEGPSWIRDNIVLAISSSIRQSIGVKPTFPVQTDFFKIRGMSWTLPARMLASIERPCMTDIESILLSTRTSVASVSLPSPPQPPSSPLLQPQPLPKCVETVSMRDDPKDSMPGTITSPRVEVAEAHFPAGILQAVSGYVARNPDPTTPTPPQKFVSVSRSIEIDGVSFSSDEKLTSLDDKIERHFIHDKMEKEKEKTENEFLNSKSDMKSVPMSNKDFSDGLLRRIKQIKN